MVDIVATGPTVLAVERVAHLVALSEVFQNGRTWQDAHDNSIQFLMVETDESDRKPERPNAVVDVGRATTWSIMSGGGSNLLRPQGAVSLILEVDWNRDYDDDFTNALKHAVNYTEGIIVDVVGNAGRDVSPDLGKEFSDESGDLNISGIGEYAISWTDPDEYPPEDRFFRAKVMIEWGDNAT